MIHLIADTISSISVEEAKELGLYYLPQIVIFGDKSYRDDSEMDSETFIKRLKESTQLPKTSAPYPSLYYPILEKLEKTGEPVLVICPSAKVSGTVRSVETALHDFPNADFHMVDTKLVASGLGSVVRKAVEWQKQGLPVDTVKKNIIEMSARNRTYFLVDTLEFLHKGGRIGAAQALVGSVLQMKPILCIKNGQVEPVVTERTRKKAMAKFLDLVLSECPKDESAFLSVLHGGVFEQANDLANTLKKELGIADIPITFLPPAILVHAGPGVLGVSFFTN
jgi:DegV family protein with EDD domain